MATSFRDKVIIVTGANDGIGAATAALFLEQGAKVAALDVRECKTPSNESRLNILCDVSSEESVEAAVEQVIKKWKTIDVLCNVAGVMDRMERISETSTQQFERVMKVNVKGVFFMTRAVIQHFLSKPEGATRRGAIVNVGSLASASGGMAGVSYTTSKHAVIGMTRNTAFMYQKDGIVCNAVLPGGTKTNIMGNSGSENIDPIGQERMKFIFARMSQPAEAVDIAKAIVFLAGAENISGAELVVDNGFSTA